MFETLDPLPKRRDLHAPLKNDLDQLAHGPAPAGSTASRPRAHSIGRTGGGRIASLRENLDGREEGTVYDKVQALLSGSAPPPQAREGR